MCCHDVLTFTVRYRRFKEMKANVEESILKKRTCRSLVDDQQLSSIEM
jgi:hypothetical protein